MNEFKLLFPKTYHSFNPFREDFEHKKYAERGADDYKSFKSCSGRLVCLIKLAYSPLTIPLKIAKRSFY